MQTQNNTSNHQNGKASPKLKHADINPVVAGVAGAIVGAGLGVAGAMAMKDEKLNKKAHQVAKAVGAKASEYAQSMKEEASTQLEDKAGETEKEVKKIVSNDQK